MAANVQLDVARPGELGAHGLDQRLGLGEFRRSRGQGHQPGAHSATTAPFQVTLYASPVRGIDKYSVPIG